MSLLGLLTELKLNIFGCLNKLSLFYLSYTCWDLYRLLHSKVKNFKDLY